MNYIVFDLEYNQAMPFQYDEASVVNEACPLEIIQIGAVKLDENFRQIGTFNSLIQPQIYPRIHPFVEKITGITQDALAHQPFFPEVFEKFALFAGKEDALLCTWGGDDVKALFRNILYYKLDPDSITKKYTNVQTYASTYLHTEPGKAIGLKNAVAELNLTIDSPFHDAFNDAVYTAKVFEVVHTEPLAIATFKPSTLLIAMPKAPPTNILSLYRHISEVTELTLSARDKKLIKLAYFLGRAHIFDAAPTEKKKRRRKKNTNKTIKA